MKVTTLQAESLLSANTDEHPDLIKPVTSTEALARGPLTHSFPNASVTVLDIPLAAQ